MSIRSTYHATPSAPLPLSGVPVAPGPALKTALRAGAAVAAQTQTGPGGDLGLFRLVTTVITLIIGGGVFTLAGDQAAGGSSGAAILAAWAISGVGVFCLVMTFFALSRIKPELNGGVFAFAHAGFGQFTGFASSWSYWISTLLTIPTFAALLFGSLAYFFPVFGEGTNVASAVGSSIMVWFYAFLVSRGIKEVSTVNAIVTVSKITPILVAIVAIIFLGSFKPDVFVANFFNATDPSLGFPEQVRAALMVTIWVFVGIEGAVSISGRAKHGEDVGKATVIAFICVLAIYLMISVLSMGVMPLSQLAALENPAMAGVMAAAVGPWGSVLISFAVTLSLIGAMLGYTVLGSEAPYEAARRELLPKQFVVTNKKGAPIVALVVTSLIIEAFIISMPLFGGGYQFFYTLSAGMILLPYLLSAAYFAKVAFTEKEALAGKVRGPRALWCALAVLGVVYSLLLAVAAGSTGLVLMALLYLPGLFVYVWTERQHGRQPFPHRWELIVAAAVALTAAVSLALLALGIIAL